MVDALPPGFHYVTPQGTSVNPCDCNTVIYSLLQACAACQDRSVQPWSTWETNCTNPGIEEYPEAFSSGTSVPAWAYLNVVPEDTFDVTAAQNVAAENLPDATTGNLTGQSTSLQPSSASSSSVLRSTGAGSQSSPGASNTGSSSASSASQTNSPTTGNDNATSGSSKKSNAGAIAGGVVGGIVGAALLGLGTFFLVRHSRARSANRPLRTGPMDLDATPASASAAYGALHTPPGMRQPYTATSPGANEAAPMMQEYRPGSEAVPGIPKVYDPDDPSTFPSAGPAASYAGYSGASANTGYRPAGAYATGPSNYSGAPEL
ncbi:hypothetical protein OBBRIDRAFT_789333 [Obba rivulosa]|uniref:Uncharacterized protein n=1 Tax=Obba rivulosa TaxID=1052685 RepID=A0A8E2J4F7_9APHY|nr:hypothetical protein OBBRIDRAFT_789333 [Obba rivulosa]